MLKQCLSKRLLVLGTLVGSHTYMCAWAAGHSSSRALCVVRGWQRRDQNLVGVLRFNHTLTSVPTLVCSISYLTFALPSNRVRCISVVLLLCSSPMGYEEWDEVTITRQVVIGGKNKYLINGRTVQQSQVTNLFHSVQLNVNNPHFLIMQVSPTDLPMLD